MSIQLKKSSIDLGIVTTNGDRMLAFYRDTLGLKYLRDMKMSDGAVMHQMLCGDSLIKLVVLPQVPNTAAPGGIQAASGYRYWTITVTNPAEVVLKAESAGSKVVYRDVVVRPGISISMLEDPDGNWVELLTTGT